MTKKEFRKIISSVVLTIRKKHGLRYIDIDINRKLPYISVLDFFAQGDSCDEILKEVDDMVEYTNLSDKTCLLYYLDSAGVILSNN